MRTKILICMSMFMLPIFVMAQGDPLSFYNSYEDFRSNKPVKGIKYSGHYKRIGMTESLETMVSGKTEYEKVKNLPYFGVTDSLGILCRLYDNHLYAIMAAGDASVYVMRAECSFFLNTEGDLMIKHGGDASLPYISQGITGEIIAFNERKALLKKLFGDDEVRYKKYFEEQTFRGSFLIPNLMLLVGLANEHNSEYPK